MSNSNWSESNLPRPPVPAPAVAPQPCERSREDIVQDLQVAQFAAELDHVDGCAQCRAWVFGDGLQCERHPDE